MNFQRKKLYLVLILPGKSTESSERSRKTAQNTHYPFHR